MSIYFFRLWMQCASMKIWVFKHLSHFSKVKAILPLRIAVLPHEPEENSDYLICAELECGILWKCNFLCTFCTCGPWVNAGEVLVALQFDFIKDVHLLLCRERTIKPHLWSTTNKIRSVSFCLYACESPFAFGFLGHLVIHLLLCQMPNICGYKRKVVTMKTKWQKAEKNNIVLHICTSNIQICWGFITWWGVAGI